MDGDRTEPAERPCFAAGGSALVMLVALMAYGREELRHGRPEGVAYRLDPAQFTEPDLKHAFLDVSTDVKLST